MLVHSVPRLCDVHFYSIEKYCDGQLFTGASSVLCRHTAGPHSYTAAQIDARLSRDVYYRYGLVTNCTRHIITCGICVVRGGARRLQQTTASSRSLCVNVVLVLPVSILLGRSPPPHILTSVSVEDDKALLPRLAEGLLKLDVVATQLLGTRPHAREPRLARHLEGDALGALDEA